MEELYRELMHWYRQNFAETILAGSSGCPLRCSFQRGAAGSGSLIIVSGRTEFIEKYLELGRELQDTGLNLCLFDHCGQGGSGRLLPDSQKGHIEDFATYVDDLDLVIETVRRQQPGPVYLLAHSMGAAISCLHAISHPGKTAAMILVSPMFAINTGPLPVPVATALSELLFWAGAGKRYVIGGRPYDPGMAFESNCLTTDRHRFLLNQWLVAQLPHAALGGPTVSWLRAAYRAMRRVRHGAGAIACPSLLLEAEDDTVVGRSQMLRFCAAAADCRHRCFPGARHELLMERDEIRTRALLEIRDFLRSRQQAHKKS